MTTPAEQTTPEDAGAAEAPVITRLRPDQVEVAAEVLLRAFRGDPGTDYMFPNPRRQERIMRGMMVASLRFGLRWGEVHTTAGDPKGVAVWVSPPGKAALTYARLMRTGMLRPALACNPGELLRSLALGTHSGLLDLDLLRQPHWYLWILGVDPEAQGQGVGSALLRSMMGREDVRGRACALETMKERNVRFYKKHGFRVTGHGRAPFGGPEVWAMRRDPAP